MKGHWLHFIHFQSEKQAPTKHPRFPSTVVEFFRVIRALAEPEDESDPAFHVICVSLPGCGYSDSLGPQADTAEIAIMIAELMSAMDYMIYAAHGSGLGGVVASQLGSLFPESCVAVHLGTPLPEVNTLSSSIWQKVKSTIQFSIPSAFFSKQEVQQINNFSLRDYRDNISVDLNWTYAVSSDPLALAAFFIQKLRNTTDCRGNVENIFSKDELLTFISMYWFSRNINSAIHLYHNNSVNILQSWPPFEPIEVPVGVSIYPTQQTLPKSFSKQLYKNIQSWQFKKRGGYFPAWEDPSAFVEEIRMFFSKICSSPQSQ